MLSLEVEELFDALESNNPQKVEIVKHKFHEQFNNSKIYFYSYRKVMDNL